MTDLNSVVLVGRLTKDIDLQYLVSGTAVGRLSVAVNRSVKKDEQWMDEANFFDVSFFGKSAENLKPYLLKGQQVAVMGALKQDRWEKDGQKFSKVSIVADNIQLLGSGKSREQKEAEDHEAYKKGVQNVKSYQTAHTEQEEQFPEDIPF